MKNITLDTIEQYTIPIEEHPSKWIFSDEATDLISEEHKDQIYALTPEASKFLWNLEAQFKIFGNEFFQGEFFQHNSTWISSGKSDQEIKKWLHNLGIPYSTKVFVSIQPLVGFVLTWKMVIKNHAGLFRGSDQTIWDKTLNWGLAYDHNDAFYFGENRIYDSDQEAEKIAERTRMINEVLEQIEKNKEHPRERFFRNPYLK